MRNKKVVMIAFWISSSALCMEPNKENDIQNILQGYKKSLITQHQKLLNNFKKHYHISNKSWNECVLTIKSIRQQNTKDTSHLLLRTQHDKHIDNNMLVFMTNRLKKNNIDPRKIIIRSQEDLPLNALYHIKQEIFTPIELTMNWKAISQYSHFDQIALCTRMTEEIIQEATLIPHIISRMMQQNNIKENPQFTALQIICTKKLPVFLPCLTDPLIAHAMMHFIRNHDDPLFTAQDYEFLKTINKIWDECDRPNLELTSHQELVNSYFSK